MNFFLFFFANKEARKTQYNVLEHKPGDSSKAVHNDVLLLVLKQADDYCSTTTNNYITGKLQLLYNFQLGDHKSAHLRIEMVCEAFNCQPATNVFH